jgi:hypothetical protein
MSPRHLLPLLIAALAAAPNAFAQYQWRDENGRMVYSDMPPPASVQPSAVQRAPARQAPAVAPGGSGATASDAPPPPTASAAPAAASEQSAAEREMAFRKRRLERAEAERKSAETQAAARRSAAACEDARTRARTLESGMRVARVNDRGEREVLDEETRTTQLESARRAMREHCPA